MRIRQWQMWLPPTCLELAQRRKLPLASRDEALCQAARDRRVKLLL